MPYPLFWQQLKATEHQLAAQLGIELRPCSTIIYLPDHPQHIIMPPWLNPLDARTYGKYHRTMYEERLQVLARKHGSKVKALAEMQEEQRAHLQGMDDMRGNHWCGHCFDQGRFINHGELLGYPALPGFIKQGYNNWFSFCRSYGGVAVAMALDHIRTMEWQRKTA